MKKLPLSIILDILFSYAIILFICFVWLRFLSHSALLIYILSFLIATIITTLIFFFVIKKYEKDFQLKKHLQLKENFRAWIKTMPEKEILDFFAKALQQKIGNTQIKSVQKKTHYLLFNNHILFVPTFYYDTISEGYILEIYHKYNQTKNRIILGVYSKNEYLSNKTISRLKNLEFTDFIDIYSSISQTHIEAFEGTQIEKKHLNIQTVYQLCIDKRKTKSYLLSGLCLLLFSFWVRYNLFYILQATLLLILAILSHFVPQKNTAI